MVCNEHITSAARASAGLALSALAGVLFQALHAPLPWMIGPLVAVAMLQLFGPSIAPPAQLRTVGQWIVGSSVGLAFRPEVAHLTLTLWPLVITNAIAATLLGLGGGWLLRRLTRADWRTCYFSAAIGGAWEMYSLAERYGAQADKVAAAHVLRIGLVVIVVPTAFWLSGVEGSLGAVLAHRPPVSLPGLAAILAITALAAWIADRVTVPNAWVIAPMLISAALTASGAEFSAMPPSALHGGQLLIGWSMGSRFTRAFFMRSPKFLLGVAAYTLTLLASTAAFGVAIACALRQDGASVILGTAPGGVAEMCATAGVLMLNVPLVTSLHLTRVLTTAVATAPLYQLIDRLVERRTGRTDL